MTRVAYIKTDKSGDSGVSRNLRGGPPTVVFTPSEMKRMNDATWLPDGRFIHALPEPDRLNECNYWEMRLNDETGQPIEGTTKRLTNWTGSCMFSSTATTDGKQLAFVKQTLHFTGYLTDLAAGGTRIENTRHFTLTDSEDFYPGGLDGRQQGGHRVVQPDRPVRHLQAAFESGNRGAHRHRQGRIRETRE